MNLKGINGLLVILCLLMGIYIVLDKLMVSKDTSSNRLASSLNSQNTPVKVVNNSKIRTFDVPKKVEFAGETISLEKEFDRIKFDRELHVNAYWRSNFLFSMKRAHMWFPIIEEVLKANNIPEDMKYLAVTESALYNSVSPAKAVGFWQLLKPTARELGLEVNKEVDERYNPKRSAEIACKFFKKAYKKFGDWTLVAASYNMGMRGLQRQLDKQQVNNYFDLLLNEETARYVFRVLAIKELMTNPRKYGYDIPQNQLYTRISTDRIEVKNSIPSLVKFANEHGITYQDLKLTNPWLRSNALTIKKNKTYFIEIPKNN